MKLWDCIFFMSKWFRINSLVKCPTSQQIKKLEDKQMRLLTVDKYFGVAQYLARLRE